MWNLIIIILAVLLILMVFYLETRFLNFNFVKKIKNKTLMYLVTLIPFVVLLLIFGFVNFVIIVFHLFIFFVLYGLLFYIIRKLTKKDNKCYLTGLFAVITTVIYLMIGYYLAHNIFETKYVINTNKDIKDNIRILQISDTHIGTTFDSNELKKYYEKIKETKPDIVVITGDYIDDSTSKEDIIKGVEALKVFEPKYGTYFVYGNHDKGYTSKGSDLINELIKNDITILEDQIMFIDNSFYLIGRKDKRYNRLSINELTKDLDKDKLMIVLNHQPNDYENERKANVDIVLSGHTHGGQLFPFGYIGVLIKANDAFKGIEKRDNTSFIINSGMSDWAMDFKTGTKSEYVIIDVIKEDENE